MHKQWQGKVSLGRYEEGAMKCVIRAGDKAASHGGIMRIKQDDMYYALRIYNHLLNNLRIQH